MIRGRKEEEAGGGEQGGKTEGGETGRGRKTEEAHRTRIIATIDEKSHHYCDNYVLLHCYCKTTVRRRFRGK